MSNYNQLGNINTAAKSSVTRIIIAIVVTIALLCGGLVGAHFAGLVNLPFLSGKTDTTIDDNSVSIKEQQELVDISKSDVISPEISQEPVDIIELYDENTGYSLLMNSFNNDRIGLRLRTPDITDLSADSNEKFAFIYHIRFARSIEDLKTNNPDIYGEIKIGPLYLGDPVPISEFGHIHQDRHDREVWFENGEFIAYIFLSDENLKHWETSNVIMLYKEVEFEGWGTMFEGEPVIFYKEDVTRLSFTEIIYPGKSTLFVTDLTPFKSPKVSITYEITSSNTITATLHIVNLYDVYILEKNTMLDLSIIIACDHDWVQSALAEEFGEWARNNPIFSFVGLHYATVRMFVNNGNYYHEDLIIDKDLFFNKDRVHRNIYLVIYPRGGIDDHVYEVGYSTRKQLFTSYDYEFDFENNNIIFYIGTYVPATEFSNFTVEYLAGLGYTNEPGFPGQYLQLYQSPGLVEHCFWGAPGGLGGGRAWY